MNNLASPKPPVWKVYFCTYPPGNLTVELNKAEEDGYDVAQVLTSIREDGEIIKYTILAKKKGEGT